MSEGNDVERSYTALALKDGEGTWELLITWDDEMGQYYAVVYCEQKPRGRSHGDTIMQAVHLAFRQAGNASVADSEPIEFELVMAPTHQLAETIAYDKEAEWVQIMVPKYWLDAMTDGGRNYLAFSPSVLPKSGTQFTPKGH
jgi:hypothetical protein